MRKKVFQIVEPSTQRDVSFYFDIFIMVMIVLSVLDIILESEKSLGESYGYIFRGFEVFSVLVFSLEYVARVWTCVEKAKYKSPVTGRIKFMFTPMALVDLMSIIPFYLPFIGVDLRFLRTMRLLRIFRVLKMARYSKAFTLIKNVLKDKKEDLVVTMALMAIILVIVSSLMYYLEREAQPENFSSISQSLWWGIVTLTTVGYGDVYPVTMGGKILGGVISLLGLGLVALPSGILASGYTEEIMKHKNERHRSNH